MKVVGLTDLLLNSATEHTKSKSISIRTRFSLNNLTKSVKLF